jgi:phosphatidylglycerophosphate synthase
MTYAARKKRLEETFRPRQEWWSRVFATPVANAALHLVADWKFITPNRLTLASFFLTLCTAVMITSGSNVSFVYAALVLQVAYVLDCMDGQLARYRGVSSIAGSFLDKWSDFVKFPAIILALTLSSLDGTHPTQAITIGFLTLFFICYQPYLNFLAKSELSSQAKAEFSRDNSARFFSDNSAQSSTEINSALSTESSSESPTRSSVASESATSQSFNTGRFIRRNLRFFLFEEAQWYLIVSLCLLFSSPFWALKILCATQGLVSLVLTIRIFKISFSKI